jgi:hypothetical protein
MPAELAQQIRGPGQQAKRSKNQESEAKTPLPLQGKGYAEQSSALSPGRAGFEAQSASLRPNASAVQKKGGSTDVQKRNIHEVAASGTRGGGGSLPHGGAIQAAFGKHDISAVRAHTGADAAAATSAMGAEAYASGNDIAFGGTASLHTAAHEAAHIVQQRAGVSLQGGVGKAGDAHEQHADAVADAVVQGRSAEGLLDKYTLASAGRGSSVQHKGGPLQLSPLNDWGDLVSYRPSSKTQKGLAKRRMEVHKIEEGWGPINLDRYEVNVLRLPVINGREVSPDWVVKQLQTNMNTFVDTSAGNFSAYNSNDAAKLKSDNSEGAVVHIDMGSQGRILRGTNVDDGSVVSSGVRTRRNKQNQAIGKNFIFSTVYAPGDANHPVSGNREFGYIKSGSGYTFYTRGADRCTTLADHIMAKVVFGSAHLLWLSFQRGLARFINGRGGSARVGNYTSGRYDWDKMKKKYHAPTQSWQDTSSSSSSSGRYIRSPDGTSIDKQTGRMIMGPGPKY